jgi:hypothetical protein
MPDTTPLNQRRFKQLEWVDGPRLKVTWEDGTASWFNCTPAVLAENYKKQVSLALVEAATVGYAEYILMPRTLETALKSRTAFMKIHYEKEDE